MHKRSASRMVAAWAWGLAVGAAAWTAAGTAQAAVAIPTETVLAASVPATVTAAGDAYRYSYTLTNGAFARCLQPEQCSRLYNVSGTEIVRWAIPYFADAGIRDIQSPVSWEAVISDENLFDLPGAGSLIWQVIGYPSFEGIGSADLFFQRAVTPNTSRSGFGYTADFGPGKAPYTVTFNGMGTISGDPPIPRSPLAQAAGLPPLGAQAVPEPATPALLLMAALAAAGLGMRARRN